MREVEQLPARALFGLDDAHRPPSQSADRRFQRAAVLDAVRHHLVAVDYVRSFQAHVSVRFKTVVLGGRIEGEVGAVDVEVLAELDQAGIEREELTLHVGAGTFRPVKSEEIEGHEMHIEYISVPRQTLQRLIDHGGQAIAVGTTSVRTLESLYHIGAALIRHPEAEDDDLHVRQWQPYESMGPEDTDIDAVTALQAVADYLDRNGLEALHTGTQIIIAPGYRYRIVKAMVTNFHQPQSTLLLLVSAFIGDNWKRIYRYALGHGFRFLSYGDSSLLIP